MSRVESELIGLRGRDRLHIARPDPKNGALVDNFGIQHKTGFSLNIYIYIFFFSQGIILTLAYKNIYKEREGFMSVDSVDEILGVGTSIQILIVLIPILWWQILSTMFSMYFCLSKD